MNKLIRIFYTILFLSFINTALGMIFKFYGWDPYIYGGVLAWLNGVVVFFAILSDTRGDTFK